MSRKHSKIWWHTNKPRVDWKQIVWKCGAKYKWPSDAEHMAFSQAMDIGTQELLELRARQATGKLGHKKVKPQIDPNSIAGQILRDISRKNKRIARENKTYQSDIDCDDPLYDGQLIF